MEPKAYYQSKKEYLKAYSREWKLKNKDRVLENRRKYNLLNRSLRAAKDRAYKAKNKIKIRSRRIHGDRLADLRKYGLDHATYGELLNSQNGVCAICGKPPKNKRCNHAPVDHCHKTGKVRGILCWHCNAGLGMFFDNPEWLIKAAAYLTKTRDGKPRPSREL